MHEVCLCVSHSYTALTGASHALPGDVIRCLVTWQAAGLDVNVSVSSGNPDVIESKLVICRDNMLDQSRG